MITYTQRKAFMLAMRSAEVLMKNGAEIHRVESTIKYICRGAGLAHVDCFVAPTGIFASIGSEEDEASIEVEVESYVKGIKSRTTNLCKISEVNNLSRLFVNGQIDVENALVEIEQIEKHKPFSDITQILGAGLCSSFFAQLFGGGTIETIFGFFIGGLTYLMAIFLNKHEVNFLVIDFICCGLATLLSLLMLQTGLTPLYHTMIIGSLMVFVPGAAITNALRDFISGDMLSGVTRATEAIAISIFLAAGAGIMLKIWSAVSGLF